MYDRDIAAELIRETKRYLAMDELSSPTEDDMDLLIRIIRFHEWRYYVKNDPVVSDYEFDRLYKMLEKLEAEQPGWQREDSPTQRVSSDLSSDFPTVRHLSPMLSLANSYDEEDLRDFDKQVRKRCEIGEEAPIQYVVEPKFDGGSIALVYENDRMVRGATRGNGAEGDEITANLRSIRSIPLRAKFVEKGFRRVELRGEALIRKDRFAKINKEREQEDLPLFANPRNMATGGLRMKDPRETAGRGLDAFIYQLSYSELPGGEAGWNGIEGHHQALDMISGLGFKVATEEVRLCNGIEEVITYCREWEEKRDDYPYEIDGMVVKVNDFAMQEKAGSTSHHPRWAIAFKFKARQATTKLLAVEYQVGKIGSITPVAKVQPVPLAGVTISSISLHNEDFITSKDLRIGDTVLVERAGDVIPYIVKAVTDARDGSEVPIEFPEICPVNPDPDKPVPLERVPGEAAWRCPVCVCGRQTLQRIIFFVSRDAMDIDGLGRSMVERFYELGWLRDIADIYKLDFDKVRELERFGERSAENLEQAIERSKENPLYRLLFALGIHHLGQRASRILAAKVEHALDLKDWDLERFTDLRDIGPVLAKNVMAFFSHEENVQLLERLESLGVNLRQTEEDRPVETPSEGPLVDKSILFTGTLQQLTRKEAKERATAAGARNISAVSGNLDILVVGEKAGSKLKKAQALGTVEIWTEAEFLEKIPG